jgi:fructan beta-fructosidase
LTDRREFLTSTILSVVGLSVVRWAEAAAAILSRVLKAEKPYLNIPVKNGAPARHVSVRLGNEVVREMSVELAPDRPDWWVFMDLTPFKGQTITMTLDELPGSSQNLNSLRQADEILGHESIYHETLRPQFHYSPKRGWMSDPNGLVYYEGEYHMFYQHYPYGTQLSLTGDCQTHWGHAVSKDLVYWHELPVALYPEQGLSLWSGSAVVDENNTAGFRTGAEKTLVALFTLADPKKLLTGKGHEFTQGLAYSNDRGRSWTHYAGNPVLPNVSVFNRDPKVTWYAPQKKWVMTLFLDRADYAGHLTQPLGRDKSSYGFFSSADLKHWKKLSEVRIPGDEECPEFYEIAVDGEPKNTRWVIEGAAGFYLIGTFDGTTFTSESGPHRLHEGTGWYASQTFNHVPASDGRRILIPWARALVGLEDKKEPLYKGMPFNQSMGIPVELTLRTTAQGLRLYANPVRELTTLRVHSAVVKPQTLRPGTDPLIGLQGELLDIIATIDPKGAGTITLDLRGVPVVYDVTAEQLSCAETKASLSLHNGRLQLRLLVDRTSIEIFGNGGQLYMSVATAIPSENTSLALTADKEAAIEALEVYTLRSIWT